MTLLLLYGAGALATIVYMVVLVLRLERRYSGESLHAYFESKRTSNMSFPVALIFTVLLWPIVAYALHHLEDSVDRWMTGNPRSDR